MKKKVSPFFNFQRCVFRTIQNSISAFKIILSIISDSKLIEKRPYSFAANTRVTRIIINDPVRLSILFILYSVSSFAQNPVYKKYTIDEGLPSNLIYQITQDSKGYIWLATDKGASRFNGTRFENFTIENGLPDNEVLMVIPDKQQRIWFKSFAGPLSFYDGEVHNSSNTPWLKKLEFKTYPKSFTPLSNGQILICENYSSLVKLNDTIIKQTDSSNYNCFFEKINSSLIQIGNDYILESGKRVSLPEPKVKLKRSTFSCYNKTEDILLIANDSGLFCYQHHQLKNVTNENFINVENGCVIISDNQGYFWLTNFNSLYRFKIDYNSKITDVHTYLKGIAINNIFQDKENNFWFATKGEGLLMIPSLSIKLFNKASGLDDNNITAALSVGNDKIVCGTLNGSIHFINKNDEIEKSLNPQANQIRKIVKDKDNQLFILSQNALFNFQAGELNRISTYANSYKSIMINSKGEVISGGVNIIASYNKGDTKISRVGKMRLRLYAICEKSSEELWLGTERGLFTLKNNILKPFHPEIKSFSSWIDDIFKTKNGEMLVTTRDSGLAIIQNNKINFINTLDGLQSNTCTSIFYDSLSGKIYLGLNNGLSIIEASPPLFQNNMKKFIIKNYNATNGFLFGNIFSVYESNGEILVSTDHGLLVFNEKDLNNTIESPKVYITHFEINSAKEDLKSNYNLTYDENNIRIKYDGISFRNAKSLAYRYQLIPGDSGWKTTFSNAVDYPNLIPGNYKFTVQVRTGNGKWFYQDSFITFKISKPYWATWWFRLLEVGFIVSVIYLLYRYQLNKKLQQQLAIAADRARISSEMHDDLGSGLSKISLLSEMVQNNTSVDEMRPHLENISRSSKEIVEKMGDIIWAMNLKHDHLSNLIAYTRKYAMEFFENTNIVCHVILPETLPEISMSGTIRRNVFLVVKEALHNVLKHSKASQVNVKFIINSNNFSVQIKDNGKGIEASNSAIFGNGLTNMKQRMKDCGGDFFIQNEEGTKIEIVVPFET